MSAPEQGLRDLRPGQAAAPRTPPSGLGVNQPAGTALTGGSEPARFSSNVQARRGQPDTATRTAPLGPHSLGFDSWMKTAYKI